MRAVTDERYCRGGGTRRSPTPAGGACGSLADRLQGGGGVWGRGAGLQGAHALLGRCCPRRAASGSGPYAGSRLQVARARRPVCRHTAVSPLTRSVRVFLGSTYRRHPHRPGSDSDVGPPSADQVSSCCGSSRAGVTARVRRTGLDVVGNAHYQLANWSDLKRSYL